MKCVSQINSPMAGNIGSYIPTLRLLLLLILLLRISQNIKLHLINWNARLHYS